MRATHVAMCTFFLSCRSAVPTPTPPDVGTCDGIGASQAYERYVEPFVSGAVAQSCGDCHLTGVDLSQVSHVLASHVSDTNELIGVDLSQVSLVLASHVGNGASYS